MGLLDKIIWLIETISYPLGFLIILAVAWLVLRFLLAVLFYVQWEIWAILIISVILWRLFITYKEEGARS